MGGLGLAGLAARSAAATGRCSERAGYRVSSVARASTRMHLTRGCPPYCSGRTFFGCSRRS